VAWATATAVVAVPPRTSPKTSRPSARRIRAPAPAATRVRVDSVQLAVKPGPVGSAPQMPPPPPPKPGNLKPPKGDVAPLGADGVYVLAEGRGVQVLPDEGGGRKLPLDDGGVQVLPDEGGGRKLSPDDRGVEVLPDDRGLYVLPDEGGGLKPAPDEGGVELLAGRPLPAGLKPPSPPRFFFGGGEMEPPCSDILPPSTGHPARAETVHRGRGAAKATRYPGPMQPRSP
jgi:hypothetical protein